jgi:ABC-2 type transport system ATP-binding protein
MYCIKAHGLTKTFGNTIAVDHIDLSIAPGRIVGLFGPNGAGKSTLLHAILGLTPTEGELSVCGRDPRTDRDVLLEDVSFISDVAVLPRWMKVSQTLDYMDGVHRRFNRLTAEGFLAKTTIKRGSKISELSKGMITQLHLALVMAIDAKLLVLDEPTIGLDVLYRRQFYESLVHDYYDKNRTILITTHHLDEIAHILTDVLFIDGGRLVFRYETADFESHFFELITTPNQCDAARALGPIHERHTFGRSLFLYRDVESDALISLGEVRTPTIEDIFRAVIGNQASQSKGASQ